MGQLKINGLPATYDKQLLTPKHDEMMKLLFKRKLKQKLEEFSGIEHEETRITNRNAKITKRELTNITIDLEHPLKASKGFIIGIIDAVITFDYLLYYEQENEEEKKEHKARERVCCGVEIKPEIKSVGEVMRQLKIYNQYLALNNYTNKPAKIVVFTTNENEREIFESQNIGYISLEEMGDLND